MIDEEGKISIFNIIKDDEKSNDHDKKPDLKNDQKEKENDLPLNPLVISPNNIGNSDPVLPKPNNP